MKWDTLQWLLDRLKTQDWWFMFLMCHSMNGIIDEAMYGIAINILG